MCTIFFFANAPNAAIFSFVNVTVTVNKLLRIHSLAHIARQHDICMLYVRNCDDNVRINVWRKRQTLRKKKRIQTNKHTHTDSSRPEDESKVTEHREKPKKKRTAVEMERLRKHKTINKHLCSGPGHMGKEGSGNSLR